jgi:hypothetical protein
MPKNSFSEGFELPRSSEIINLRFVVDSDFTHYPRKTRTNGASLC